MPAACLTDNEAERLLALASYQILDTPAEPDFDAITRLVAYLCEAPFAVINLVADGRQFFKSEVGLGVRATPLATSICSHALLQPDLFIVSDLSVDERFSDNPLVTGTPALRFYAGALLKNQDGFDLGTLCVLDTQPRSLTEPQRDALRTLASHVMNLLELRRTSARDQELLKQQVELNARLDRAVSGQHRVSAMVAHDLRSPLSVVAMGAQLLALTASEPKHVLIVERIRRAVTTMQALIEDLLDLELAQADALRLEPAAIATSQLVSQALDTFAPLAAGADVALISSACEAADVFVDNRRILQVLANLIGNALKVSPRGAQITIAAVADRHEVEISVSDQGPGISLDDQARVFEPFWRKDATAKGAGLGLTISKRIVDASGGRMGVRGAPGGGATFWFTVPTTST